MQICPSNSSVATEQNGYTVASYGQKSEPVNYIFALQYTCRKFLFNSIVKFATGKDFSTYGGALLLINNLH